MRILFVFLFLGCVLQGPAWGLKVGLLFSSQRDKTSSLYRLAEELASRFRLEGLSFEVAFYDPGREGRKALLAVRKAKEEGVAILLGPMEAEANQEVMSVARAYGLPLILLTGDVDPLRMPEEPFRGVFRLGLSPRIAAKVILRCLARKGYRRIGLLLSLDEEGKRGVKWLKVYAWEYRLRIEKTVWFGPRDTALFYKLEELLPVEAVVIWSSPEASLNVARELRRYGLRLPVVFGPAVSEEDFLLRHSELYGFPFPATALYLSERRELVGVSSLSLEVSALVDALFLLREILLSGGYPTEKTLENLGKVSLPGGTYYLSSDDHYGLWPQTQGVFTFDLQGFKPYCSPELP